MPCLSIISPDSNWKLPDTSLRNDAKPAVTLPSMLSLRGGKVFALILDGCIRPDEAIHCLLGAKAVDCRVAHAPRNDAKPVVLRQTRFIYPRNDAKPAVTLPSILSLRGGEVFALILDGCVRPDEAIHYLLNAKAVDCRVAHAPRNDAKPVVLRQTRFIYPRNDAKHVVTILSPSLPLKEKRCV